MNKKIGRFLRPNLGIYGLCVVVFAVATFFTGQYILAGAELMIALVLVTVYIFYRIDRKKSLRIYISKLNEQDENTAGRHTPFPMVVIRMEDGIVVYGNTAFVKLTGFRDRLAEKHVSEVLPVLDIKWLSEGKTEYPYEIPIGKRKYRAYGNIIRADDQKETRLGVIYFTDLTELYQVRDEYIRSRPVVSLILVDNYDELTRNLTEGATSALNANLNNAITKWTEEYHGLLRRLEKNRFVFVFEKKDLNNAIKDKFSLLEDIHRITSPSGLAASISFGLGVDGATFEEGYDFAALAIEMALSRGGDQAVIKDRYNFSFYGGRTKETERYSKVRSRVMASALMELIGQSSNVFIMGHKFADLDAVGAAMGVACLCRKKGKQAYIVLDVENNVCQKLINEIRAVPEYKHAFISGQDAMLMCDNRSTLVVVDTNRPDQVEYKPLLETISKVCVVDHHRRAADYITPVVVNLHEIFASSASELATELLEYAVEKTDVLPIEAKSLLAGIFLDTKSFHVRTGERTFQAAGYLRQLGADTVEVKKLLQSDFGDALSRYEIISAAQRYNDTIAISVVEKTVSRTLAAQAADELLNISGIETSFVLYPDQNRVIISARSIGSANVQVILEALGGGGNSATAGAQIPDCELMQARSRLLDAIDKYFES